MPMNSALDITSYSKAQLCTCRSDDYMSMHLDIEILQTEIPSKTPLQLMGKTCVHPRLQYFVEML